MENELEYISFNKNYIFSTQENISNIQLVCELLHFIGKVKEQVQEDVIINFIQEKYGISDNKIKEILYTLCMESILSISIAIQTNEPSFNQQSYFLSFNT